MSEEYEDAQFMQWARRISNQMTCLAKDLEEAIKWAPEGEDVSMYVGLSTYLWEQAQNLNPDIPEFPLGENVVKGPWR